MYDTESQFQKMKESVATAIKNTFPVERDGMEIRCKNVVVKDDVSSNDYDQQKRIKLDGGTLSIPVYADLELIDKKENRLVSTKTVRIADLPRVTDRGSYIVGGNEYQVGYQLRLRPGIYTTETKAGDHKVQINLSKGGVGKSLAISIEKDKVVVKAKQSVINLYDLLRGLGMSHSIIEKQWGQKAAGVSGDTYTPEKGVKAVESFKKAFTSGKDPHEFMRTGTRIDPESTIAAVGKPFDTLSPELMSLSAGKLMRVLEGTEKPQDRDSIVNKSVHGIEDFIVENIVKRNLAYKQKIQKNLSKTNDLDRVITPSIFGKALEKFFVESDKSSTTEQTNPLTMLGDLEKITIVGKGGLDAESHQITDEMRQVHSSHMGFIDPIATPESEKVGAMLHVPIMAKKVGDTLHSPFVNIKTGQTEYLSPAQAEREFVAAADQYAESGRPKLDKIKVMHQGEVSEVSPSKVTYRHVTPKQLFSVTTNMIPFLNSDNGNRAMMASKHLVQAVSLVHREAPLVQTGHHGNTSFEDTVGATVAKKSPVDGKVTAIEKTFIEITPTGSTNPVKIPLYHNFHLNQKTFYEDTPLVRVGDVVKKGQLIADNNYTRNGTLALGVNLKTAYIPYKGYNFEDGIVISNRAAEKLTSEHMYRESLRLAEGMSILSRDQFYAEFPTKLTPGDLSNLDSQGIIKKGTKVRSGDTLICSLLPVNIETMAARISKSLQKNFIPQKVGWHHEDEGVVTEVQHTKDEVAVYVRTIEKAKVGDKLALRHGAKGVITKILDDKDAPKTADGDHVDVLLNPHGIIGRINVGQVYESALAKIADKKGAPIVVHNFSGKDHHELVTKAMETTGIKDKEELFDPETGKSLGMVHVGKPFMLKLYKQSEKQYSARGTGPGYSYDSNLQPTSGGSGGSKSTDLLTIYAMLAHGAKENLREMSILKGQRNDEFWAALKAGYLPADPKVPYAFEKFTKMLNAAGIGVTRLKEKDGSLSDELALHPLTDKDIASMSKMTITDPAFLMGKDLKPIKGGFVDERLGGMRGESWAHMEFKEPLVNPVFEKATKSLLGLKASDYDAIVYGKKQVNGLSGGFAIKDMLARIDIKKELAQALEQSKTAKKANLDSINRKVRYLRALDAFNIRPEDAYVNHKIPVLPPVFRPLNTLANGAIISPKVNYIYQGFGVLNKVSNLPVMDLLDDKNKEAFRRELNEHNAALRGTEPKITVLNREASGFLKEIAGPNPKEGFFQSHVLKKQQDLVGRGVIMPEPSLHVDEVGIPEDMLWKIYEPFIVKQLTATGMGPRDAQKAYDERDHFAKMALMREVELRPVLLNRAPSLHKFSIMGFKAKPIAGKSIKIPPMIVGGFGADFDGDTMTVHVPVSDKAVEEAWNMRPSLHLYKPGSGKLMLAPSHEAITGLYLLSQSEKGREAINAVLPQQYHIQGVLTKKVSGDLFMKMSKELPSQEFTKILIKVKALGDDMAYRSGFTLGVEDFKPITERDSEVKKVVEHFKSTGSVETSHFDKHVLSELEKKNNNMFHMVNSGARGEPSQVRQIVAAPLYIKDSKGKVSPTPITKSFAEGLSAMDYWQASYGARSGMIDKQLQTSKPGAFSKEIMATMITNVVLIDDCGTRNGVDFSFDTQKGDCTDRFTAGEQHGLPHNTLITTKIINDLERQGIKSIRARSPLTCQSKRGTCRHCTGIGPHGTLHNIGDNVGALAGEAIGEPLTQMSMKTFHTGSVVTSTKKQGIDRIEQLLKMPDKLPDEAPVAEHDGVVVSIDKSFAGHTDVIVKDIKGNMKKYVVFKGNELHVKKGDKVVRGQVLSAGPVSPHALLATRGLLAAQNYLADELQAAYREQGQKIDRKTFELVVRSATNSTKITKPSPHADWVAGDIVPHNTVQAFNNNLDITRPTKDCEGFILNENIGPSMPAGTELTLEHIKRLLAAGKRKLNVRRLPVEHEPELHGISLIPALRKDWLAQMGFQSIVRAATEGASEGWKSNIRGPNPIPAVAYGVEMGREKKNGTV